jgi:flagellar assembly factor FliW
MLLALSLLPIQVMKTFETDPPHGLRQDKEITLSIPGGLLGFEDVKSYQLISAPEEDPLMWLEMIDRPNNGFLVVSPISVEPGYKPQISQQDLDALAISSPADLMLLNIVTLRAEEAFANLKGPIVINRRTWVARQCVPANSLDFSIEHPIHMLAAAA